MVATPPLFEDNIVVERYVPESFIDLQESDACMSLLFNEPVKRSHERAEAVLFRSGLLDIGLMGGQIRKLYAQYQSIFKVDFRVFAKTYQSMVELMESILPAKYTVVTEVSKEDECLFNYYEFEDKKIIFNLFFDEEEKYPIAQVCMYAGGKYNSMEGPIEKLGLYLKEYLASNSHA